MKPFFKFAVFVVFMIAASGCATFNLGPSIKPLKEKTLMGKGSDKVLLLDIQGLISNRDKRSITGFPIKKGMVETVREILIGALNTLTNTLTPNTNILDKDTQILFIEIMRDIVLENPDSLTIQDGPFSDVSTLKTSIMHEDVQMLFIDTIRPFS
ncbi:MAG: hypothetical protein IIB46_07540, partial [Nitrospinae bacterium]|nr:hypothetical protein [Nitrospinota bacterium]